VKFKQFVALMLSGAMTAAMLCGCGGAGSTSQAESVCASEDAAASAATEEKQVIDIAVFEGGLGAEYWEEMMRLYQKEHPNVEFTSTISPKVGEIIRPRIVSGDAPDLLVMTDGDQSGLLVSMIKDEALMDITDVFEGPAYDSDTPLKDVILDGYLESKKFQPYGDGKIYIAPKDCGYTGLIYNKALFAEKGWEVPTTWDEFFALGDLAKEEGRALFTYQGIYPDYLENILLPTIASAVGQEGMERIFNYEEGSFNNPEVVSVLEQFERIAKDGYLMEGTVALNHTQSQTDMMEGKALFIPNGVWMVNEMKDAPREEGFSYGMMSGLVLNEDDPKFVYANYGQISIPKDAKNPEGAKDFLRFLYTEESARIMAEKSGTVLAIKGGLDIAKEYIPEDTYNMFNMNDGSIPLFADYAQLPTGSKVNVADEIYSNGATKVMSGQITAQEWAELVEKAFAQIRSEREKLNG